MNRRPPPRPPQNTHLNSYQARPNFDLVTPIIPHNPTTHPNSIPIRVPACSNNTFRAENLQETPDHPPGFPVPVFRDHFLNRGFELKHPVEWGRYYQRRLSEEQARNRRGVIRKRNFKRQTTGEGDYSNHNDKVTICITNVSREVSDGEIRKCCSIYGKVHSLKRLASYWRTDVVLYLVKFAENSHASVAVKRLEGTRRFFRSWKVKWAREEIGTEGEEAEMAKGKKEGEFTYKVEGVESRAVLDLLKDSWLIVTGKKLNVREVKTILDNMGCKSLRFILVGVYGVIAVCDGDEAMEVWKRNLSELRKVFAKVEQIDIRKGFRSRFCWIQCQGIPLQAWSFDTMENIASNWGNLIALDGDTDYVKRVDRASLFVETREIERISTITDMVYKKEKFKLVVKEVDEVEIMECTGTRESYLRRHINGEFQTFQEGKLSSSRVWIQEAGKSGGKEEEAGSHGEETTGDIRQTPGGTATAVGLEELNVQDKEQGSKEMVENVSSKEAESNAKSTSGSESFQVDETVVDGRNASPMCSVKETPIFVSIATTNERGEKLVSIEGKKDDDRVVEQLVQGNSCDCCRKYNKREDFLNKDKQVNEVEIDESMNSENSKSKEGDVEKSTIRRRRAQKGNRKKGLNTPLKYGAKGILGGRIIKPTKKNKKKYSKNKQSEDCGGGLSVDKEVADRVKEAKKNFVEKGIQICDEIGVKGIRRSARKLNYNDFLQNSDSAGKGKEVIQG